MSHSETLARETARETAWNRLLSFGGSLGAFPSWRVSLAQAKARGGSSFHFETSPFGQRERERKKRERERGKEKER